MSPFLISSLSLFYLLRSIHPKAYKAIFHYDVALSFPSRERSFSPLVTRTQRVLLHWHCFLQWSYLDILQFYLVQWFQFITVLQNKVFFRQQVMQTVFYSSLIGDNKKYFSYNKNSIHSVVRGETLLYL